MRKRPLVLMILDGFGLPEKMDKSCMKNGVTPEIDRLMKKYPFVSGKEIGRAHV